MDTKLVDSSQVRAIETDDDYRKLSAELSLPLGIVAVMTMTVIPILR